MDIKRMSAAEQMREDAARMIDDRAAMWKQAADRSGPAKHVSSRRDKQSEAECCAIVIRAIPILADPVRTALVDALETLATKRDPDRPTSRGALLQEIEWYRNIARIALTVKGSAS